MTQLYKLLCTVMLLFVISISNAQETLDSSDVSTFIIGGGQVVTNGSLFLNAVALVDVAPGGQAVISDGVSDLLEAGMPVFAGGTSNFLPEIWVNYTYRPELPGDESEIFIRTNMPIPSGITLSARVVEASTGGDFIDRGISTEVSLSTTNAKIVDSFGAGYTDDDENNGYKVEYTYNNTGSNELPSGFSIIYELIKK